MKMKKMMVLLMATTLITGTALPVYAEETYSDETTDFFGFDDRMEAEDDLNDNGMGMTDDELQKEFDRAMNDNVSLGTDDFSEVSANYEMDKDLLHPDNMDKALASDFETAMQDENIKLSETGTDTMNLISSDDYDIDVEYGMEVNDYAVKPRKVKAASTVSRVEYGRTFRIYRKRDNATMVQWVLKGLFLYNGKTSKCKQSSMSWYNNATNLYTVTAHTHYASGMYAVGNCRAIQKKTGKVFSRLIKVGVTPTGRVIRQ